LFNGKPKAPAEAEIDFHWQVATLTFETTIARFEIRGVTPHQQTND
jgi:hypothetical protein